MKEAVSELWTTPADLRVVTTNGYVKTNGEAVMGAGCAKELATAVPTAPKRLGALISEHGNRPVRFARVNGADVASLPVKHHWREEAEMKLIIDSLYDLLEIVDKFGYQNVVMPRPGCGNGRQNWNQVRGLVEHLLDDRFTVVDKPRTR